MFFTATLTVTCCHLLPPIKNPHVLYPKTCHLRLKNMRVTTHKHATYDSKTCHLRHENMRYKYPNFHNTHLINKANQFLPFRGDGREVYIYNDTEERSGDRGDSKGDR